MPEGTFRLGTSTVQSYVDELDKTTYSQEDKAELRAKLLGPDALDAIVAAIQMNNRQVFVNAKEIADVIPRL